MTNTKITAVQLRDAIQEAGGSLKIENPKPEVRSAHRSAIHALVNSGLLLPGTRLTHRGRDRGDLVMSIVGIEEVPRQAPSPEPIPVPTSLRRCHPIVTATEEAAKARVRNGHSIDLRRTEGVAHIVVTKAQLHRSLVILQALIGEAQRRGYQVTTTSCQNGLTFVVNGFSYEVAIKEPERRVAHVPTREELQRHQRDRWATPPSYDYFPSGQLVVRSCDRWSSPMAREGVRWKLEDKLHQVFDKLEAKAVADELRRQEGLRQEALRKQQRDAAIERARQQYYEQHRRNALADIVGRMALVREGRVYLEMVRVRPDLSERDQAWLQWVKGHLSDIDPFTGPLAPPDPPEPSYADLGVSPWGWR